MNKGFNKVERLKEVIARFHDRGILVDGGIIFGFDTDTPDVFDRTIEALKRVKIDSVAVNILIPYPGTEFYRMMEIVYRAFKQPNAVATITRLIANVGHRMNCVTNK